MRILSTFILMTAVASIQSMQEAVVPSIQTTNKVTVNGFTLDFTGAEFVGDPEGAANVYFNPEKSQFCSQKPYLFVGKHKGGDYLCFYTNMTGYSRQFSPAEAEEWARIFKARNPKSEQEK